MGQMDPVLARGAGDRTPAIMDEGADTPAGAAGLDLVTPGDDLDQLAAFVRAAYPECQRAFRSYQAYRFAIGLALIKARALLAIGPGGIPGQPRNPAGRNQHSRGPVANLATGPQCDGMKQHGGARMGQEEAGLMAWMRREFPDIPYRTLARYRQWVEFEALPVLRKCWAQLELQLEDPRDLDVLALPAPKRDQVVQMLREATTARDITLTLRAMGEAKGDPDAWGPRGGDNTPRDADGRRIQRSRRESLERKVAMANARVEGLVAMLGKFDEETARIADLDTLGRMVEVADEFARAARLILRERKEALV